MPTDTTKTDVGSYFIANYPPFSQWTPEGTADVEGAMQAPAHDVPLGLYLHIPFCRKRCKFCYFKVFTEKNGSEVEEYLAALSREIELVSRLPVMGDRPFRFVYFGGGTPSFLSSRQLVRLVDRLRANIEWDQAEEVTFECEPGTLSEAKLKTLKDIGITRLSLGIENFSDAILESNGRAHLSGEVYKSWDWIVRQAFDNVNVDLIAGMVGETWDNWRENVRKVIELDPDSVTIYQMELPFNTIYSRDVLDQKIETPVADWPTKRAWVDYAFGALIEAGYAVSSTCTVFKNTQRVNFSYRDNLWHGSDLVATGIASFGHLSGVHYQNCPKWDDYVGALATGQLPLWRGLRLTPHQLLIREMILQLKTGRLEVGYFRNKFDVDIVDQWRDVWNRYADDDLATVGDDGNIVLSRSGLLQVDALLPAFFEQEHQGVRYT